MSITPATSDLPRPIEVEACVAQANSLCGADTLPRPIEVVGLPIRPFDMNGLIDAAISRAKAGMRTFACYANAHTVNLACADVRYRRALTDCDLLYCDGASVVWASRFAERRLPCRITAMDYFPVLAQRCAAEGLSMYLLGSQDGTAEKAAAALRTVYPTLNIVGIHTGHFDLARSDEIVSKINAAAPDVLAVGMSSPRQELWLADHGHKINAPLHWCVGALFDYLAGQERRAPQWLCRLGLEWLFRLAMDPIGKSRRYLLGNPKFIWNTLRWRDSNVVPTNGVAVANGVAPANSRCEPSVAQVEHTSLGRANSLCSPSHVAPTISRCDQNINRPSTT